MLFKHYYSLIKKLISCIISRYGLS